ncbi:MAG: DUF2256 domain-containing protein [Nanoarchaeota archaeon]|nr:DUF2256 domain-containing protein [Nanoarchaeota archaeon]
MDVYNEDTHKSENFSKIFKIVDRGVIKEAKCCIECGKVFVNRKKWKDNFKDVKFCSQKCKLNHKNS